MRVCWLVLLCSAFGLAACASTADTDSGSDLEAPTEDIAVPANELGPQTLAAGECGLFGWTADEARRFTLFATQDRGAYWDGSEIVTLNPQGLFPNLTFDLFDLELGEREALDDAVRYPSARTRTTLKDGFERVQPLVILETCQTETLTP